MVFIMTSNNPTKQFPSNYFIDTYGLSAAHSEVLAATPHFVGDKALDVGCGRGRNAIYLAQHGYHVDAVDANPHAVNILDTIIEAESLDSIQTTVVDLNQQTTIDGQYDVIICTVVMMFLAPDTIPTLISEMQKATKAGGINVIVSAMDTEAYPLQPDLSFAFKENELSDYYADWELLKYNEKVGEMHRRDANGDFVKMQFATMIAKKPNR